MILFEVKEHFQAEHHPVITEFVKGALKMKIFILASR
jgi:hypothetical protein